MRKPDSATLQTASILAGIAAAAWAFMPKPNRSIPGTTALITGGSRGLGLALAERFGRAGFKLTLAARDHDELIRARDLLMERGAIHSSDDAFLVPVDLTVPGECSRLIDHAIAHFGHLDVLVNNAGIIEVGPVEDQPLGAYHRAMATNFFAALHLTHAALPHLLQRGAASRTSPIPRPAIVNIASIGGKFAMPHLLPYVASKFALVGFSEGLHAELRHKNVRVTTVCPGLMRTGSHIQAHFVGNQAKEYRWFALGATTLGIAASTTHAANRIYNAVLNGRAEITITPQAWLAARVAGLAPETTQYLASLVNQFILPSPAPNTDYHSFDPREATYPRNQSLEAQHNQNPKPSQSSQPN